MSTRELELGLTLIPGGSAEGEPFTIPTHHLVTHSVAVGMTGSGKTGLAMVVIEETLRSRIPVIVVDVKGDMANLLLTLPSYAHEDYASWIDEATAERREKSVYEVSAEIATERAESLKGWHLSDDDIVLHRDQIAPRVFTPGTTAGEAVNVLSGLETPSPLWQTDLEGARLTLNATISLVLRLVGRDADPTRSRDHVVLSHFAERRLRAGRPADLGALLHDLAEPPVEQIGEMAIDDYLTVRDRKNLAAALNSLVASTTFDSWRRGTPLDIGAWMAPRDDERTPLVIVSVAHLDDEERGVFLGLLFDELLAWVRTLPGTSDLRALIAFDEVYGFLPPHPSNPPAKRPLLTLMKQARGFGVGILLATQNPMDVDYRALSNAGVWFVGRLQTDADRERVVEGMTGATEDAGTVDRDVLTQKLKRLCPRWFMVRDVHARPNMRILNTRSTLAWMRGPMTRSELKRLGTQPPSAALRAAPSPETRLSLNSKAFAGSACGRRGGCWERRAKAGVMIGGGASGEPDSDDEYQDDDLTPVFAAAAGRGAAPGKADRTLEVVREAIDRELGADPQQAFSSEPPKAQTLAQPREDRFDDGLPFPIFGSGRGLLHHLVERGNELLAVVSVDFAHSRLARGALHAPRAVGALLADEWSVALAVPIDDARSRSEQTIRRADVCVLFLVVAELALVEELARTLALEVRIVERLSRRDERVQLSLHEQRGHRSAVVTGVEHYRARICTEVRRVLIEQIFYGGCFAGAVDALADDEPIGRRDDRRFVCRTDRTVLARLDDRIWIGGRDADGVALAVLGVARSRSLLGDLRDPLGLLRTSLGSLDLVLLRCGRRVVAAARGGGLRLGRARRRAWSGRSRGVVVRITLRAPPRRLRVGPRLVGSLASRLCTYSAEATCGRFDHRPVDRCIAGSDAKIARQITNELLEELFGHDRCVSDDELTDRTVIGLHAPTDPHRSQIDARHVFERTQRRHAPHHAVREQSQHDSRVHRVTADRRIRRHQRRHVYLVDQRRDLQRHTLASAAQIDIQSIVAEEQSSSITAIERSIAHRQRFEWHCRSIDAQRRLAAVRRARALATRVA